jgi:hypothetical protein
MALARRRSAFVPAPPRDAAASGPGSTEDTLDRWHEEHSAPADPLASSPVRALDPLLIARDGIAETGGAGLPRQDLGPAGTGVDPISRLREALTAVVQEQDPHVASRPLPPPAAIEQPPPVRVPGFVEYRPGNAPRHLLGTLFVATAVVAVVTMFSAVEDGSRAGGLLAVALGVLAAMLWWALLSWMPTVVSISQGILEVARGARSERFDLGDPATSVGLRGSVRSPGWRAEVSRPDGARVVLRRHRVRPAQFVDLVQHYRHGLG